MTPKEKAEELVNKFFYKTQLGIYVDDSKKLALIAVDEIIKSKPSFPYDIQFDAMPHFRSLKYWQEVRNEIENL